MTEPSRQDNIPPQYCALHPGRMLLSASCIVLAIWASVVLVWILFH